MKYANIAIFIPHLGCGQSCSFCNQNIISGTINAPTKDEVFKVIKTAIDENKNINNKNTEIAFFGGSFTAINKEYMIELLTVAKFFIDKKKVKGIRISTRPDCIDVEVLKLLKYYGVTSIELGCQSLNDYVLLKNLRGHTEKDCVFSAKLIKEYGFSLGLQMMVGLYGSSYNDEINTANKIKKLKPDTVRVYPTIVMPRTLLNELYLKGEYKPLTLDEAVNVTSEVLGVFYDDNINVIKVGLHSDSSMEKGYITGPYHPSFRELCESKIYLKKMYSLLKNSKKGEYIFLVDCFLISKYVGQHKSNIKELEKYGYIVKIIDKDKRDNIKSKAIIMEV